MSARVVLEVGQRSPWLSRMFSGAGGPPGLPQPRRAGRGVHPVHQPRAGRGEGLGRGAPALHGAKLPPRGRAAHPGGAAPGSDTAAATDRAVHEGDPRGRQESRGDVRALLRDRRDSADRGRGPAQLPRPRGHYRGPSSLPEEPGHRSLPRAGAQKPRFRRPAAPAPNHEGGARGAAPPADAVHALHLGPFGADSDSRASYRRIFVDVASRCPRSSPLASCSTTQVGVCASVTPTTPGSHRCRIPSCSASSLVIRGCR